MPKKSSLTDKEKHRHYLKQTAKQIIDLQGDFVECGVKYGTSSIIMAKTLKCNGYLFDTWGQFVGMSELDASKSRRRRLAKPSKKNIEKLCQSSLKKNGLADTCRMIKGDVRKTLPDFLETYPHLRFKMVHLDLDLFEPTKISLELLWPKVVVGGKIFFHDYGSKKWKGIKKCVDDFMDNHSVDFVSFDIEACCITKKA